MYDSLFARHDVVPVKLITAAATTPVSVAEVKTHLRIDTSDEDTYLGVLIEAVTDFFEKYTKRDFITKTYRMWEHEFREGIEIRKSPNVTITSITYYDADNVSQTLSSAVYTLTNANDFPVLGEAVGQSWPTTYSRPQAVTINFTCGYGASSSSVPAAIRQAILIGVGALYVARGDCGDNSSCGECEAALNGTARALLQPYRILDLAVNKYNVRF